MLELDNNSNNEVEMEQAFAEGLEELNDEQAEEVTKEFLFTVTLTLAVLMAITLLLTC